MFQVVAIGDACSGKTSFIKRVSKDEFQVEHTPTIGSDMFCFPFRLGNFFVKLRVWDMPGMEKLRASTFATTLRFGQGMLIFGDASDLLSLESMAQHLMEADRFCAEKCVRILIINKIDSPHPEYETYKQNLAFLAKPSIPLYEVSVKNRINMFEALGDLVASMIWIKQTPDPVVELHS